MTGSSSGGDGGGGGGGGVRRVPRAEPDSSVSMRGFLMGLAVPASVAALQQMFFDRVFMGHALFVAVVFCGAAVAVMHSSYQERKIQVSEGCVKGRVGSGRDGE